MSGIMGLMPHGHPRSRDWGRDNIPCKRISCESNSGQMCVIPTRCILGEDGRCEGYVANVYKKPE